MDVYIYIYIIQFVNVKSSNMFKLIKFMIVYLTKWIEQYINAFVFTFVDMWEMLCHRSVQHIWADRSWWVWSRSSLYILCNHLGSVGICPSQSLQLLNIKGHNCIYRINYNPLFMYYQSLLFGVIMRSLTVVSQTLNWGFNLIMLIHILNMKTKKHESLTYILV